MPSPSPLDLEALIRPISEESSTGIDLRLDPSPTSPYYQVKDARSAARADERQGLFGGVIGADEAACWRPVADLAPDILRDRAKDLEIAAFLIEALARTHGFGGLRDGFRLARELVERFWDEMYPMPDEYGMETRVAPLVGLNGSGGGGVLLSPIARIPITQGSDQGPFAKWNVDQAVDLERLDADAREERVAAGATEMAQINAAVMQTDAAFYANLVDDLNGALEEWAALGTALDERAGAESPATSHVRSALEEVLSSIRHIASGKLPAASGEETGDEATPEASSEETTGAAQKTAPAGELATREQALQQLVKISEFFKRTEPHSPLAYILERGVRWAHTPLPQLLGELIPDQGARETFNALTGVQTTEAAEDA
ncbi:MAG: type VI secretion system protein TssA [Planctomycetota bacterium]|nr:type VI secretion system protein TssA [Planctomycetota bacterium]